PDGETYRPKELILSSFLHEIGLMFTTSNYIKIINLNKGGSFP
ncbi:MAG: hypothetical protein ACI8RA_002119, partial [Chlamydiales bacterium]